MIEEHDTDTGTENEDELRAENWLRQQGYRDIRRPCSDPPDIVIDGDCAVEVTRLNQRITVVRDSCAADYGRARAAGKTVTRYVLDLALADDPDRQ